MDGVTVPITAWLHVYEYIDPDSEEEVASKREAVLTLQDQFPSYLDTFRKIIADAKESSSLRRFPSLIVLFSVIGCWAVPIQLYFSSLARRIWYNVMMHYVRYLFMSIGCWTNSMQRQLSLIDNFSDFEDKIINPAEWERRSSITSPVMVSNPLANDEAGGEDTVLMGEVRPNPVVSNRKHLSMEEYERKTNFTEYLAAMTSCRSVMWQLIPGMTGFALFAVDTSSCPIFVFSEDMSPLMTPLIVWNAWTIAKERIYIRAGDRDKKISCWQVLLCALYIFVEESRLVQFFLAVMTNVVAYCIIFGSIYLRVVVKTFLGAIIITGCIRVGYAVVPLYKFFFPAEAAVEDSLDQPIIE